MRSVHSPHQDTRLSHHSSGVLFFFKKRFLELWGVCWIILSGILMGILWSYDAYDPSFNTAIEGPIHNWGGEDGACIADLLVQGLGFSRYTLIFMMLIYGLSRLYHAPLRKSYRRYPASILFLITLSMALQLSFQEGGLVGHMGALYFKKLTLPLFWSILGLCLISLALLPWALHSPKGLFKILKSLLKITTRFSVSFGVILKHIFKKSLILFLDLTQKPKTEASPLSRRDPQFGSKDILPQESPRSPQSTDDALGPLKVELPKEKISRLKQVLSKVVTLQDKGTYQLPPLELLSEPQKGLIERESDSILTARAQQLKMVLDDFAVKGDIVKVKPGPVVTLFELVPAPGVKASRIIGLADDIARSMCALSARIAVIPGKNALGIELPNANRETVLLRELLACHDFDTTHARLSLVLGKDISGSPVIADLARMPHLLVAGTTGSGKSVAINTMILSLLYRLPPEKCRFIMIDPKMLELSVYNDIPHLLSPVVTDPKKAIYALKWTVREMEDRYRAMSRLGVRNIEGYNQRLQEAAQRGETLSRQVQTGFDPETGEPIYESQTLETTSLPYIVVVVDEMADLMMVAGKEIEAAVQRLAQMARAAGIHLIMATQRPSVDVITGTIKANFPTRISFQVTSKFDSRTILGEQGSEQLLGRGDMLYMETGGKIQRVHGPFASDEEVLKVVEFLKAQGRPQYVDSITDEGTEGALGVYGEPEDSKGDQLYQQAVDLVSREGKASTSFVQRHLQIGYNRAARIIEQMEAEGIISSANHVGKREVLRRAS